MVISTDQMRDKLRKACKAAGSQTAWAKANGLSTVYISDALSGRRPIGEGIASKLGYEPVTMYKRIAPPRLRSH